MNTTPTPDVPLARLFQIDWHVWKAAEWKRAEMVEGVR